MTVPQLTEQCLKLAGWSSASTEVGNGTGEDIHAQDKGNRSAGRVMPSAPFVIPAKAGVWPWGTGPGPVCLTPGAGSGHHSGAHACDTRAAPIGRRSANAVHHSEIVSFLWGVADLIRDTFKRGKYQDVILPLTVLRRLDCVLAGTKGQVLAKQAELKGKELENLDPQLRKAAGFAFYNTSRYDFDKLLADAPHLAANLRNYIAGFSPEHARGAGEVRLRQHHQQAGRGGAPLPGAGALQERGPAPGQGRQPDDGDDLRRADPQVQRGASTRTRASTSRRGMSCT